MTNNHQTNDHRRRGAVGIVPVRATARMDIHLQTSLGFPATRSLNHRQSRTEQGCDTIPAMDDFRDMVHDPKHRRSFERLLLLAAQRGDADLVRERLAWGIDPNCVSSKGRTAMMVNIRGSCPSAATIQALLSAGADPSLADQKGLTALEYARRKLVRLQAHPHEPIPKSSSLDENNQLQLGPEEQRELDKMRRQLSPESAREFIHIWWSERLRAARRVFNDPQQVEKIVDVLEAAYGE